MLIRSTSAKARARAGRGWEWRDDRGDQMTPPHLTASPATTLWGRLPSEADAPVLSVEAGTQVTIDTVSHEGILEDQGRDPVAFFGSHGVPAKQVLTDAIAIAAGYQRTTRSFD